MNPKVLSITTALLSAASLAQAAQPAATLACAGSGGSFNISLSYFSLGATNPSHGPQDPPPSRTLLLPLTVNAALGSFETLLQAGTGGTVIPSCTLTTQASNGDTVQFTLKSVAVVSVSALASAATAVAPATSYAKGTLTYTSISVLDAGGGADDGGASPGSGYNLGANQKT